MPNRKSPNRKTRTVQFAHMLDEEYHEGLQDGLATGLNIAQRIATFWGANETLVNPHDTDKLRKWTQDAINELKTKLGKVNEHLSQRSR